LRCPFECIGRDPQVNGTWNIRNTIGNVIGH
jgi:hypothetical protein